MVERLTTASTNQQLLKYINNNLSKYNDLTIKLSSGDKITNISEDPTAAINILNTGRQLNQIETFKGNIVMTNKSLGAQDSVFSLAISYAQKGYDTALQASTGTYDKSAMTALKADVDELIKTMTDLANTEYNGNYMFSGTRIKTVPYTVNTDTEGNITVSYSGSDSTANYQRKTEISDGVFEPTNITGDQVYGYYDKVQATNGAGNKLFEDAAGEEVFYNDATKKYMYTTPVDPSDPEYHGNVDDLTKKYQQATDNFGNTVFESTNGDYVYFDGADYFYENGDAYTGDPADLTTIYDYKSKGIFGSLCELSSALGRNITAMENSNSAVQSEAEGAIRATLDKFSAGINNISTAQTKFGGVLNRLEMTSNTLDTNEINLTEYLSDLKDIDYTTAITEWLSAQYAYQASLTATSQSMNLSLLNYM